MTVLKPMQWEKTKSSKWVTITLDKTKLKIWEQLVFNNVFNTAIKVFFTLARKFP